MASAPLHEAGKTTKSGNTLKPGIRREELGFASDNLSSDPNAYPLISTFSRPHSEVASTTHIPALKGIPKRRFAVFWFTQAERPPTNTAFKNAERRKLLRQKIIHPQPAETYHGWKLLRQKIKSPFLAEFYHKRGPACWAKSNG
ncbi:MAG TPA: hypothetical protein H9911_03800 [Candidatus Mediterraneibacter tabaqchaliae]|uniref:Uncharacterized protein n=1 Tax=Candidatus Mediterraneibacter tabaqchaliae TaxID=2838689 RepID=A0A9D2R4B9_9FIRM|nr:hypothetical protein [Candidatus Mediterraneibacter tabaqchaliae]